MKKINKVTIFVAVIAVAMMWSCEDNSSAFDVNTILNPTENNLDKYDYSSEINQTRVDLAKSIVSAMTNNPAIEKEIINECNKMFDGDRNVLYRDLIKNEKLLEIKDNFDGLLDSRSTTLAHQPQRANAVIMPESDLTQVYLYQGNESGGVEGVVVIPEDVKEFEDKDLMLINNDGSIGYVSNLNAPNNNYLVISENERLLDDHAGTGGSSDCSVSSNSSGTGMAVKRMIITKARFTSIEAKQKVESWWGGEPEVRLNVIMPFYSPLTNSFLEARNSTYYYVNEWIKTKGKNEAVWNMQSTETPTWDPIQEPIGRRIVFTEEDGKRGEVTFTFGFTDKESGLTHNASVKVPATDGDALCADSWVYYWDKSGYYNWGLIEFYLQFKDFYVTY